MAALAEHSARNIVAGHRRCRALGTDDNDGEATYRPPVQGLFRRKTNPQRTEGIRAFMARPTPSPIGGCGLSLDPYRRLLKCRPESLRTATMA